MSTQIAQDFAKTIVAGNIKSAMGSVDAKKRDMYYVPVDSLTIMDDFNVRSKNDDYATKVREIADSIKANGFYPHKPFAVMVIKENGAEVLAIYDGHTRFDGLKLAISEGVSIERVPVVCAPSGTTLEDITVGLVTNNSGRQLEPMGLAIVCKRLIGYGLDNSEISKRLGFSSGYVGNLLTLVGAPKVIRDMVSEGKVSATLAVTTLKDHGEDAVSILEESFAQATENGKTKITAKNVPTALPKKAKKVVPTLVVTPRAATPLELGLDYIKNNVCGDSHYALMSAMLGFTVEELKAM